MLDFSVFCHGRIIVLTTGIHVRLVRTSPVLGVAAFGSVRWPLAGEKRESPPVVAAATHGLRHPPLGVRPAAGPCSSGDAVLLAR
jgi:hypothetical protein